MLFTGSCFGCLIPPPPPRGRVWETVEWEDKGCLLEVAVGAGLWRRFSLQEVWALSRSPGLLWSEQPPSHASVAVFSPTVMGGGILKHEPREIVPLLRCLCWVCGYSNAEVTSTDNIVNLTRFSLGIWKWFMEEFGGVVWRNPKTLQAELNGWFWWTFKMPERGQECGQKRRWGFRWEQGVY